MTSGPRSRNAEQATNAASTRKRAWRNGFRDDSVSCGKIELATRGSAIGSLGAAANTFGRKRIRLLSGGLSRCIPQLPQNAAAGTVE